MISQDTFYTLLYIWSGLAVATFVLLLFVTAPYGRHTTNKWGPTLPNRWGWFIMEIPVLVVFAWFFFTGDREQSAPDYIIFGLFAIHYIRRIFIYPFQMHENGKRMPLVIVFMAIFFNIANGYFNGYWFGYIGNTYDSSYLTGWQFISGIILFFAGFTLNVISDQTLLNLRKGGKKGYRIPYGGLFEYISSPNLLGEIIEWAGWALMAWCMPAFSFALWTAANLIPRSLDHHRWYHRKFKDYPKNRKALIPYVL
jgi:protein-S-isoprenylcysteine O-methyltransferase Ste14